MPVDTKMQHCELSHKWLSLCLGFFGSSSLLLCNKYILSKNTGFQQLFFFFGEYYSQLVCLQSLQCFRLGPGSAKADTPSELYSMGVIPLRSVMWCRHGLVHEALKDSGTGLYFKGVNTTFVNFFF